jgi:hypothetical protein
VVNDPLCKGKGSRVSHVVIPPPPSPEDRRERLGNASSLVS